MLDAINGMILVIKILIVYSEVGSNVCNTDPCLKQAALNFVTIIVCDFHEIVIDFYSKKLYIRDFQCFIIMYGIKFNKSTILS